MIDRADLSLLDPELVYALALAAIHSSLAYGTPAGPGHHSAQRKIARMAVRTIHDAKDEMASRRRAA